MFPNFMSIRLTGNLTVHLFVHLVINIECDPVNSITKSSEAAKWNSAIFHFIIYTCVFPIVKSQNVFWHLSEYLVLFFLVVLLSIY